ncbi:MAG: alkaline phosphatase family protein [Gammaproteobacteria bacterium]|nr:alkaline phosphatase family protein [Gammaproteobacteria bacterium]
MKKNVLLITADQWRGDCLGVADHPLVKTPNLDALAREGVRYQQHYSGAAPCGPARACLYTGLYQMNNRVCSNGTPLDQRHDTLGRAARRAGYDPVLFGYTDQTIDPRELSAADPRTRTYEGVLPGFERRAGWPDDELPWLSWLEQQGYPNALDGQKEKKIHQPVSGPNDPPTQSPPIYQAEHTQTAYLADEFMRWLNEQKHQSVDQGPGWFAHLSFLRPHPPFCVPEPFNSSFNPSDVPDFVGEKSSDEVASQHPYLEFELRHLAKDKFLPGVEGFVRDWNDTDFKTLAAIYYGMIAEVDAQLGRVFAALRETGFWDNTIVVFTSDHGEQMGDHRLLGKMGFYDQSYHIPLIIRDPGYGVAHGKSVTLFTESVDVMPTLLDLVGQPVPAHLDGKSLVPTLRGETPSVWRASAHWEFDFRSVISQRAEQELHLPSQLCNLSVIRDNNYKYVNFAGMPPLLFDLAEDPGETINRAEYESYQSIRLYLAEKLLRWRAEHLDQSLALTQAGEGGAVSIASR